MWKRCFYFVEYVNKIDFCLINMMCIKEKFNNKTTSKFQSYKIIILIRPFPVENKQFDTFKSSSNCNPDVIKRVGGGGQREKES